MRLPMCNRAIVLIRAILHKPFSAFQASRQSPSSCRFEQDTNVEGRGAILTKEGRQETLTVPPKDQLDPFQQSSCDLVAKETVRLVSFPHGTNGS